MYGGSEASESVHVKPPRAAESLKRTTGSVGLICPIQVAKSDEVLAVGVGPDGSVFARPSQSCAG
jgi:hypothetical protein